MARLSSLEGMTRKDVLRRSLPDYPGKNPYWGTALQAFQKIREFCRSPRFINAPPVPGAAEALQGLRDAGYRLIIVTARSKGGSEQTAEWLDRWFKGACSFRILILDGFFRVSSYTLKFHYT